MSAAHSEGMKRYWRRRKASEADEAWQRQLEARGLSPAGPPFAMIERLRARAEAAEARVRELEAGAEPRMKRRRLTKAERDMLDAADAVFPTNTCPASRHVHMAAELLMKHGRYDMIADDPGHVAVSMLSVVASLWKARTMLEKAGIDWFEPGRVR